MKTHLISLVLSFVSSTVLAQTYEWADPKPYHAAAVKVDCENSSAGSGVYVRFQDGESEELRAILTCRHLRTDDSGRINATYGTATFQTGEKVRGEFISSGQGDIAILLPYGEIKAEPIDIAEDDPTEGEKLELLGFGGPSRTFRPYFVTSTEVGSRMLTFRGNVIHGDSGAGLVNQEGKVVGIQSIGMDLPKYSRSGVAYYTHGGCCVRKPIRRFLLALVQSTLPNRSYCYPYCPPQQQQYQPRSTPQLRPYGELYPAPTPKPKPIAESVPQPKPEVKPEPVKEIDYEKLAKVLVEKHKDVFKGPKGDKGDKGDNGTSPANPPIDLDKLADAVKAKLPLDQMIEKAATAAAQKAVNGIDIDLIASRAANLVKLPPPPTLPTLPPTQKHVVVVVDRAQDYWLPLSDLIQKTQASYAGVRIADKPTFEVGPMPKLVVYEQGSPQRVYEGLTNVNQVLQSLSNGGTL